MSNPLFRQEALDNSRERLFGEVLINPKISHICIAVFLCVWTGLTIAWLSCSEFSRKETVSGWIEPSKGIIKVFPESNLGKIAEVFVSEGEEVSAGQLLMNIRGDRVLKSGGTLSERLAAEYRNQDNLLQERLKRLKAANEIQITDIERSIRAFSDDLTKLSLQIETNYRRLKIAKDREEKFKAMFGSEHVSENSLNEHVDKTLTLQSEIQGLERTDDNIKNHLRELKNQQALLPLKLKNDIAEIQRQRSTISQRLTELNSNEFYAIRSPVNGRVSNLQGHVGQTTSPNLPILSILPEDSILEIKLLVPVRAVGFVERNQTVKIRYNAFPYQKFGTYEGVVTDIGQAVLLPAEVSNSPSPANEPVYLVKAALASDSVDAYGKKIPLKAGMTLNADISLSVRTILEWLLEPILSLKGRV